VATSVSTIRNAITSTLKAANLAGLSVYPTIPTNWQFNGVAVAVGTFSSERVTFDGGRNWRFDLIVRARATDHDRGQTLLSQYLTAGGILDGAFGANPNLNGVVGYAWFEDSDDDVELIQGVNGGTFLEGICRLNVYT
jgi:hypothetical protein